MKRVYLYKGFERFWHWAQVVLVFTLMLTGFEIHGSFSMFGYSEAVSLHNTSAWMFMILIVFSMFWHITTSEWRQYIPTSNNLKAQLQYYLGGIFKDSPHPTGKTLLSKLNPLQRITYFGLKIAMIPLTVMSGLLYMFFHYPIKGIEIESLEYIALVHTAGAYLMIAFLVVHLYLITTGHTVGSNLKAMLTGWEDMNEKEVQDIVEDIIHDTEKIIKPSRRKKVDVAGGADISLLMKEAAKKNLQ